LLSEEIRKEWCSNPDRGNLGNIVLALRDMQSVLCRWSKQHFGAVTDELNKLRRELDEAQAQPTTNRNDSRLIKHRIDELLYREEMIWLQRSRVAWLKEGDRNTKYFRQQAKWRAQKNKIRKLYRPDGSWCENQKDMQNMARQFF
jgi:hypothetical protein